MNVLLLLAIKKEQKYTCKISDVISSANRKGNMVALNKSLAMLQLHITTVVSVLPSAVLLLAKKATN